MNSKKNKKNCVIKFKSPFLNDISDDIILFKHMVEIKQAHFKIPPQDGWTLDVLKEIKNSSLFMMVTYQLFEAEKKEIEHLNMLQENLQKCGFCYDIACAIADYALPNPTRYALKNCSSASYLGAFMSRQNL